MQLVHNFIPLLSFISWLILPPCVVGLHDWQFETSVSFVPHWKWWVSVTGFYQNFIKMESDICEWVGMYVFSGLLPKDYRSLKAQYLQVSFKMLKCPWVSFYCELTVWPCDPLRTVRSYSEGKIWGIWHTVCVLLLSELRHWTPTNVCQPEAAGAVGGAAGWGYPHCHGEQSGQTGQR